MAVQQTVVGVTANLFNPQNPSIRSHLSSSMPFTNTLTFTVLHTHSSPRQMKTTTQLGLGLGFRGRLRCSMDHEETVVSYPKPSEIPWKKELWNSVHLIGVVGTPVEFKQLSSGKVVAWTRLGVRKSATDTVWINLTFWDELAHTAVQHVEKGHRIYVSGRLVSDTVEVEEKQQTYYKVVVQQLNFVENGFSSMSFNERETNSMTEDRKLGNYAGNIVLSTKELWQAFFANPLDWWDNRKNKRNPKYPDFKHKDTGEALWVEGKYNPPWVKSQLAVLDSRMESFHAHEASIPVGFAASDDSTSF